MTAAHMFLRRMLWRPTGGPTIPEPVVSLLGPHGSGKSTVLRALSRECGGTVVHARLDFTQPIALDPIAAVAVVAFQLMRGWTNLRRDPTFHRVGLCLLALNEQLENNREVARGQIKELIRQYVGHTRLGQAGDNASELVADTAKVVTAVTKIAAMPQGQAVEAINEYAKPVIAALLHRAARWGLRGAMRWHSTVPEAEDANTIDSLIALSQNNRHEALNYLMKALLADIQDNVAHHPASAGCRCLTPQQDRHDHAWVLLVDNADTDNGGRFLTALLRARQERMTVPVDTPPQGDPLLVVAAVEQWNSTWGQWWREPWRVAADAPTKRPIPLFSEANRVQWAQHIQQVAGGPGVDTNRGWYPVWLDPLTTTETATIAPRPATEWDQRAFGELLHRLTANRPAAVIEVQQQISANSVTVDPDDPVPRSLLSAPDGDGITPLWERVVSSCLSGTLLTRRPWRSVPSVVAVTTHLGEPRRLSDDLPAEVFPDAARTLRELRTNLWVSTFAARPSPLWRIGRGDAEHPATVHPWLARCLLAGLAAESDANPLEPHEPAQPSEARLWDTLFTTLAGIHGQADLGRALFCDLACNQFTDVVTALIGQFDDIDHRAWVRLLDDVTSAPCRLPAIQSTQRSYDQLSPEHVPGRSPLEAATTSLVAVLWLYRDLLTVPRPRWDKQISTDFTRLAALSGRGDVSALDEAARQFAS